MPHARLTDPETSQEAAKSVSKLTETYDLIIATFRKLGPMNDDQLLTAIRANSTRLLSDSGIRSRRSELASMGKLQDSGQRIKMQSGRLSIVWELA
jgi:hypothetical protein